MSYIPDIRSKYKPIELRNDPDKQEINPYWEKFMSEDDQAVMDIYDLTADIVESFFSNLDVYQDVISESIREYEDATEESIAAAIYDEADPDVVNAEVFDSTEYGILPEDKMRTISFQTYMARILYECMHNWLEMHRNEIGVGVIDGMTPEEYEARKTEVLSEENVEEDENGETMSD